jgi:competence protein ComEC
MAVSLDIFEQRRWFLWFPMAIALGSALYFSLPKEPAYAPWVMCLLIAIVVRQKLKKHILASTQFWHFSRLHSACMWLLLLVNVVIAFSMGFISAKIRTSMLNSARFPFAAECSNDFSDPVSSQNSVGSGPACSVRQICSGTVESVEDVPRGTLKSPRQLRRCVLSQIDDIPHDVKIRVQGTYKKLKDIKAFDCVTLDVELFPPPTRLTKHGYDAQFDAYFKGLSAFGKVHSVIRTEPSRHSLGLVCRVRAGLSDILRARLPSSVASLATALITGDKSGISLKTREDFTRSGLSHMLAISGLHMGLIAWLIFAVLTKLLVLIPHLATRFLVKKIAAVCVIPFLLGYLVLSGMSFSALRAFIMVTLSMLAIILNQRAISLRNTAIAACIILLMFPESVYSVSFQLSFASVVGLCYAYSEAFVKNKRKTESRVRSNLWRLVHRRILSPLQQSVVTTLIATLATTPIVIYVFQRATLVGVLGNLVAVPFLSLCVMPLIACLIVAPVDLVFNLLGKSLTILARIAEFVAGIPGSNFVFPRPTLVSVLLITFGSLWFIIWQGRKRWLLSPCFVAGWIMLFFPQPPEIFLTRDLIGVREADKFYISSLRFGSFHAKVWSQECGVQEVLPMKDVKKWRDTFEHLIPEHEGDVVFAWRDGKSEVLSFTGCRRPWQTR